jgi:hypothetical protein
VFANETLPGVSGLRRFPRRNVRGEQFNRRSDTLEEHTIGATLPRYETADVLRDRPPEPTKALVMRHSTFKAHLRRPAETRTVRPVDHPVLDHAPRRVGSFLRLVRLTLLHLPTVDG